MGRPFSALAPILLAFCSCWTLAAPAQRATSPGGCTPEAVFRNLEAAWNQSGARGRSSARVFSSAREFEEAILHSLSENQRLPVGKARQFIAGLGPLDPLSARDRSTLDELVRRLPAGALQGPTDRSVSGKLVRSMIDFHRDLDPVQAARVIGDWTPVEKAGLLATYRRALEKSPRLRASSSAPAGAGERAAALKAALREEGLPEELVTRGAACGIVGGLR